MLPLPPGAAPHKQHSHLGVQSKGFLKELPKGNQTLKCRLNADTLCKPPFCCTPQMSKSTELRQEQVSASGQTEVCSSSKGRCRPDLLTVVSQGKKALTLIHQGFLSLLEREVHHQQVFQSSQKSSMEPWMVQ